MFYAAMVVVLMWKPVLGAHILAEDEPYSLTEIDKGPIAHRRVKRQLGEVALQISHLLEFLITAASGTLQHTGRFGQDLIGRNDGGILSLVEGLFVGIEVSSDFVRNLLNALLGTLNTAIGTPSDDTAAAQGQSANANSKGSRPAPNREAQRRRKQSIDALRDSPSLGKQIQAELRELRAAQRRLWVATTQNRPNPANNEQHQKNRNEERRIPRP